MRQPAPPNTNKAMYNDKTFYLWCGIEMNEMLDFMRMLCESCYSFDYNYEVGEITVRNITDTQLGYIEEWICENDLQQIIKDIPAPDNY